MTRILSMDDEPGILDVMGLILERAGCEHLRATSAYEAWAILHSEPIDLVTQDLMRPDMDGWEFLRLMKAEPSLAPVPVILITSRQLSDNDPTWQACGADAYLVKPFGPKDLLATVEKVLIRRGLPLPKNNLAHGPLSSRRSNNQDQTIESQLQALKDRDWKKRWKAALALGQSGEALSVEPLLTALRDDHAIVRMMAAWALGELGDRRAVEPLKQAQSDPDDWVRRAATTSVHKIWIPAKRPSLWSRFLRWCTSSFSRKPQHKPI